MEWVQSGDNFHLITEAVMTRPLIFFWLCRVNGEQTGGLRQGRTSAEEACCCLCRGQVIRSELN